MKTTDLKKWIAAWKDIGTIVLWGYGKNCMLHIEEIKKDYAVEAIVDNDENKDGTITDGIPVMLPQKIELRHKKIVITTHYEEISAQLKREGFEEYVDFCDMRILVSAGSWYQYGKVVLSEVHIAVTTACTLNCKYCNMYMPFHKNHILTLKPEEVKEQIQLLFTYVDRVSNLILIGGETLLYQELDQVIRYICECYRQRVGNIEIVTNGTVLPKAPLLEVLKENQVLVSMSNYQLNAKYQEKFEQVKQLFAQNGVKSYSNADLQWKDFAFPYRKLNLSDAQAYENMNLCNPVFRGFNDSKLYFCHLVWSANKAGIYQEQDTDYIDFRKITAENREEIVLFHLCCRDSGYVSLCKDCGGCSNRNQSYIPVGEQVDSM